MAGPSQPAGQTAFVGGLDNSGDFGFREGNPGLITDGQSWDFVPPLETAKTGEDGDGVRITRSTSARLQGHGNEIPGSGKNVPGGGVPKGGGSHPTPSNAGGQTAGGGGDAPGGSGGGTHGSPAGGGGRSGNGANAHPGRAVGAGGPSGGSPSVSAGAAALLAKMFSDPLRDPVPSGAQFLPCDTEEVKSEREGKGGMYSPVMWADPLLPLNMSVGSTSSSIDRLPAVG